MTVHRSATPRAHRLPLWSASSARVFSPRSGNSRANARDMRASWQRQYTDRLRVSDTAVVCAAVTLAHHSQTGRVAYSVSLLLVWLCSLSLSHSRSPDIFGATALEYRRVAVASFGTFGALAVAALLIKAEVPAGYLAVVLPAGTIALLLGRRVWRGYLAHKRLAGSHCSAVLVIGRSEDALKIATELTRDPKEGYRVVGFRISGQSLPHGDHLNVNGGTVPIVKRTGSIPAAARACRADTVLVVESGGLGVQELQRLIWDLEPMGIDLVISPCLIGVAPSRLRMRQAAGLSLLHVKEPQYHAGEGIPKRAFDFCFALIGLTVALPILVLAAVAIKIDSRGPVFYRSERIGRNGKPFTMFKLRTMVRTADQQLGGLMVKNECDGPLFKIHNDPRVTSAGRFLRRFSVDELPQFFNVLRSEMSVVGPRPPLRREVDAYKGDVRRRLLVRPGITGPWQISGRCELPWDQATRLDLAYVDNWSLVTDLVIIAKTLRAVFQRKGAY